MERQFLNGDGQPVNRYLARARIADRQIDELIGICKGVLADGLVFKEEVDFLLRWMESNRGVAEQWPVNVLYSRLLQAVQDGVIDSDEEREIIDMLLSVTGGVPDPAQSDDPSAALPLDDPQPVIEFDQRLFCVTGKFVSGTREEVVACITDLGGLFKSSVQKKTDYLVIGELASRDWIHAPYGRKIEKAIEIKQSGGGVMIVSERHFLSYCKN